MPNKKVRGLKRKVNSMVNRIEKETIKFPSDFYNGYWHLHLPVGQGFISSPKTPVGIKRICIQALLKRAEHLVNIKPDTSEGTRIVVAVDLPGLWNSQIIVFKGESYYKTFFDRNDASQKWTPLPASRNIEHEWKLTIPKNMKILGFREEITDEKDPYVGEIWFIGELN
ncbi:DUF3916 domain-containing protein [Bacillus suaedae]|uniref:DUF3916 domain-containing protein n=1 Tax=Halalkalibacter suaedae TaxID=2822140 RepID=A0A940WT54_9BACI|nr:DUF3916 domain-containing protein [Bacillus suaedae]MBP3951811.1 DUF3916 domain-containing protein [Bacillus suaedae]